MRPINYIHLVDAHGVELEEDWQIEVGDDDGREDDTGVVDDELRAEGVDLRAYAQDRDRRDEGDHQGYTQWHDAHRPVRREVLLCAESIMCYRREKERNYIRWVNCVYTIRIYYKKNISGFM